MDNNSTRSEGDSYEQEIESPFLHYPKGGENAPWRVGFVHRLTTLKMISCGTVVGTILDAVAFYALLSSSTKYFGNLEPFEKIILLFLFTAFIFLVIFVLALVGHYKSQRWILSDIMHRISHELRDMTATVGRIKERECKEITNKNQCGYALLMLYCNQIADYVEQYFAQLTKVVFPYFDRQDLRCVIRLTAAYPEDKECRENDTDGKFKKKYITVGRSKAYNLSARKVGKALDSTYGVFGLLLEKKYQGVLICNDLERARAMRCWSDPVDAKKDEKTIQSIMVAPINGYIDGTLKNIGTITVDTYRKGNVFQRPHIRPLLKPD